MKDELKHGFANVNGIRMHYVTQGKGKLLLLLHGFPDFWRVWKFQISELAKHFRVVAPDLRGYNETDKPEGVEKYSLNFLVKDIRELITALGEKHAILVGHDWGGIIAWSLAAFNPETIEKLVILNAPHPQVYMTKTQDSFRQLQKSWYIFFFQTPDIPEQVLSRKNYAFLRNMIQLSFTKKGILSEEDWKAYAEAWSKPGGLKAAINYYRANSNPSILFSEKPIVFPKIKSPTLVIWGEQDKALSKDLIVNTEKLVDASYSIKYLPNSGHWVQLEEPELVNQRIMEFLTS